MVVLLPAPLGPSRLKISPRAMSKLTPSTASTPLGGSYCLRRSWTSTMLTNSPSPCGTAADASLYTARHGEVTRRGPPGAVDKRTACKTTCCAHSSLVVSFLDSKPCKVHAIRAKYELCC